MSAIAGNGVQRQIDAVPSKAGIDPSHRVMVREVVTQSRKIDQFHPLFFSDAPAVRMSVKNGLHLAMEVNDFEQPVRIQQPGASPRDASKKDGNEKSDQKAAPPNKAAAGRWTEADA